MQERVMDIYDAELLVINNFMTTYIKDLTMI